MLCRVDAQKPDPFRLSVFVEAGDRVTIVDCLDPPERPAGLIGQRTHGNREGRDSRNDRGHEQIERPRPGRQAPGGWR